MSLETQTYSQLVKAVPDNGAPRSSRELELLNRYLAVLEDNKKASSFIPDEAALALDMAGFVRNRLHGGREDSHGAIARLALCLVPGAPEAPVQ